MSLLPSILMENYHKSVIDVFVLVLESDGYASTLALAINAASMALCDASIEMRDIVCSSSVTLSPAGDLLVDATSAEEEKRSASVIVAYMPSLDAISHVLHYGSMEVKDIINAMEKCLDVCGMVHKTITEVLLTLQ